jgi:hypothetical protein
VEDFEGSKKLGEVRGGELQNSIHQERYNAGGELTGRNPVEKTAD